MRAGAGRLVCSALVALSLPAAGCEAILGIQDPIVATTAAPDSGGGSSSVPSQRTGASMVYDSARQRIVLFGGCGLGLLGDTWEWDGTRWTEVTPATSPPPREGAMMAYDAAISKVVLFGGSDGNYHPMGDTWEWDGTRWTQAASAGNSPPARFDGGMAYDAARGRVVLFAGSSSSTGSLDDTWEWDGTSWAEVTPASGSPPTRSGPAMAYDAAEQKSVLFGGRGKLGDELGDTWTWDGQSWTDLTSGGDPPARDAPLVAYDGAAQDVVLFGGLTMNDTWAWNGTSWTNVSPPSGSPSSSYGDAMTYDPDLGGLLLYAGGQDMWKWDGSSWMKLKQ